jgi:hypothetical protein
MGCYQISETLSVLFYGKHFLSPCMFSAGFLVEEEMAKQNYWQASSYEGVRAFALYSELNLQFPLSEPTFWLFCLA